MKLQDFWPDRLEIMSCIKTEAETVDQAVFLAVHQSMLFRIERIGAQAGRTTSGDEHRLLKWFLEKDLGEARRILPIVGSSGIGKSHVIRWLDANLRVGEGANTRHVIRIPKSSSLKTILGLLLEGLDGEQYDDFRERLGQAREDLDPDLAAGLLGQHIKNELRRLKEDADRRLSTGGLGSEEKDKYKIIQAFCGERMLPALLGDPTLEREHWQGGSGALSRIASHATKEAAAGLSQEGIKFKEEDLKFSPEMNLNELNAEAVRCIVQLRNHRFRAQAAEILNSVLDQAKAELMNLGGSSLTDLFKEIRRALHQESPPKELVLLIEDFAVMMGLQRVLFEVMSLEGFRDGKQELCTMRTALAFTPGAIDIPDTVKTRAGLQWHLDERPKDEEFIHEFNCNLIGAYLNAARVGVEALQKAHRQDQGRKCDWPPKKSTAHLESDDMRVLEAFGCANEYPLFPFNRAAIRRLALEGVSKQGELVLNPRELIKNVLHAVLDCREEYLRGRFPPGSLGDGLKNAEIIQHINRKVSSKHQANVQQLLAVWANQPESFQDAAKLPEEVYGEFELPYVDFESGDRTGKGPSDGTGDGGSNSEGTGKESGGDPGRSDSVGGGKGVEGEEGTGPCPVSTEWKPILEEWQAGIELNQVTANKLRKTILDSVTNPLEWDTLLFSPITDVTPTMVYIPLARGQKDVSVDNAIITLCRDEDRSDPSRCAPIRMELLALLRQSHYKTWDYVGAENDRALYLSFVERHREQAMNWLLSRPVHTGLVRGLVPALVQGLYVSGRLEGRRSSGIKGDAEDISVMFQSVPVEANEAEDEDWRDVMKDMRALRIRDGDEPTWVDMLLAVTGARQGGTGKTVHAVDVSQILPHIRGLREGQFAEVPEFGSAWKGGKANRKRVMEGTRVVRTVLEGKLESRRVALERWHSTYVAWSGGKGKDDLVEELRGFLKVAKKNGVVDDDRVEKLRSVLSEFKSAAIESELSVVSRLIEDTKNAGLVNILKAVGLVNDGVVALISNVIELAEANVAEIERRVSVYVETLGEGGVSEGIEKLQNELGQIGSELEEYERIVR